MIVTNMQAERDNDSAGTIIGTAREKSFVVN